MKRGFTLFPFFMRKALPMTADESSRNRRAEDKYTHLEKAAAEKEIEILAKKDGFLSEAKAEYERDVAGFKFQCAKWGHFLNLSVARLGNPEKTKETYYYPHRYWSGAVNLNLVKAMTLKEGHSVDCRGEISYEHYQVWNGKDYGEKKISASYRQIPDYRQLPHMATPSPEGNNFQIMGHIQAQPYKIKRVTPNWPRPAEDDEIIFAGAGVTLYVPAGMGAEILKQIALATGHDKP